ncbi:MAG: tetratricopeptide repeat protein [Bacillota bacterium]|nr:tetratricopeptide repeat protein [Bacillota bacterium]
MFTDLNMTLTNILAEAEKEKHSGKYLLALEKYKEAQHFVQGQALIEVLFAIADLYSLMDNYHDAMRTYSKILDLDSNLSGAWYGLAYSNELLGGDLDQSLDSYERAIDLDKSYKEAYYYAATIYADRKDFKKAKTYFEKVVDLDPLDFIAYNDLGSLYEEEKDYAKAKTYIEKSLSINQNYYLSHFNLGVVYKALALYDKALEEYKLASQLSDDIYIYLNMSAIYIETKEYTKAVEILSQGIEKNPHHILYYNRACSYRKLGQIDLALKDYRTAKAIDDVVEKWAQKDPDLKDIIKEQK